MVWICLILFSSMCSLHLSTGQVHGVDLSTYCESCIETAKEIEIVMGKATSYESRKSVIEDVMSGALCERHTREDMKTSCKDLFETHNEKIRTEMMKGHSNNLEMRLCYDASMACVGVKRQTQTGAQKKPDFQEDDIRALLHTNKDRVRTARPLAEMNHKDEL